MEDLLEHNSDLSAKLMQIGDSIVYKLVQWTKRLPFYLELPVEVSVRVFCVIFRTLKPTSPPCIHRASRVCLLQVHTRLLTHKWHELLVLTTSAYQAIHGPQKIWNSTNINGDRNDDSEFNQEVSGLKTTRVHGDRYLKTQSKNRWQKLSPTHFLIYKFISAQPFPIYQYKILYFSPIWLDLVQILVL